MSSKGDTPRRGDFGWQAVVSAFEPTLEDMMSDRSCFGMPPPPEPGWGSTSENTDSLRSTSGE